MDTKASYDLKFDRAEHHLVDLEAAIGKYVDSHPYEMRVRRESKKKPNVHRLHFTKQPGDDIALITADAIYNIRSGLDHLAAALVPAADRDSVMFPIFFQGVWEPVVEGESEERRKARGRWRTATSKMYPQAVAILKMAQPPDDTRDSEEFIFHGGVILNRLSNTDRHSKLPVVASGLAQAVGSCRVPGGKRFVLASLRDDEFLDNGAELLVPKGAVDVQLTGTPEVVVRYGPPRGANKLPDLLDILLGGARRLADGLRPFERRA